MHSPERLTLPLMVQSGDGATGPEADASRIALAFSGGLAAPRIVGLLVADAPVPWRDERALPHPGLGFARGFFVGLVVAGDPDEGQRPAARHHPFLDVFAVDLAARDGAAAAIGRAGVAGPALVADMLDQFVARRDAAGPAFAVGVEAELIDRRRVDAAQANAAVADLDLIAIADFRHAGDIGRPRDGRAASSSKRAVSHVFKIIGNPGKDAQ